MIEIERAEPYRKCNVCHSNKEVCNITFYSEGTNQGNQVALCKRCVWNLINVFTKKPHAAPEEYTPKRTETHSCDYGMKGTHGDVFVRREDVLNLIRNSMNDLEYNDENKELQDAVRALPYEEAEQYEELDFVQKHERIPVTIKVEEHTPKRTETHECDCDRAETHGDLISRQSAIDDLHGKDPSQIWDTADIEVWINALPSAEPERKTGRWISLATWKNAYRCSECGRTLTDITDGKNNVTKSYPYCHCGAKMEVEQDG